MFLEFDSLLPQQATGNSTLERLKVVYGQKMRGNTER